MNKFQKRIIFLIVLTVVITFLVLYFTIDINTIENLTKFSPIILILALISISFGLFLDGVRLVQLVKISGEKISFLEALQVVFGNYFLALLTPGFSGGAIAQVLFLRHSRVPVGKATVIVIVRTLVSIFFLFLCLPFIFLSDSNVIPWISDMTLTIISIFIIIAILLITWAFQKNYLDYFVIKMAKKLKRKRAKSTIAFYRDTKLAVNLLLKSKIEMIKVFFVSGLSLIFIYAIVPILMLGVTNNVDCLTVMGRMILLNLLLYFSPTPGGSGIAEGGFILLFNSMLPEGTVGIIAVTWRLIVEYIPFLIGFYYTIKVFGRDFLNKPLIK